jgi:hypothetical protein
MGSGVPGDSDGYVKTKATSSSVSSDPTISATQANATPYSFVRLICRSAITPRMTPHGGVKNASMSEATAVPFVVRFVLREGC